MPDSEGVTVERDDPGVFGKSLRFSVMALLTAQPRRYIESWNNGSIFSAASIPYQVTARCLAFLCIYSPRAGFVTCLSAIKSKVNGTAQQDLAVAGAIETFELFRWWVSQDETH